MKILLASSEVFPFSKSGGLADVVGALGRTLGELGHEVQIITPYYKCVAEKELELEPNPWMTHVTLNHTDVFGALRGYQWQKNVKVLFLDHQEFFDRDGLYGTKGNDYEDNAARFLFFCKAIWQWVKFGSFKPDIIHLHDWQTALFPLIWHHLERTGDPKAIAQASKSNPKTVLTIHNLAYQGVFQSPQYPLAELPWDYYNENGVEFFGQWNCLKAGIIYADKLTTVSPKYAEEIQQDELGCSLNGVLSSRKHDLSGILNGVDYSEWKTQNNPNLPVSFGISSLGMKSRMKKSLQKEVGLEPINEFPVFANIGRIVEQKGMDILIPALKTLLQEGTPFQFVQLGTGDPNYESQIKSLAKEFPQQVSANIKYDHSLAHRIEAGSDFFLMPSRFEPCGLNQLYSLRYGSIPIVRATGGLHDSVTDFSENLAHANGFKFSSYTIESLLHVIRQALALFQDRHLLNKFRKNAMREDFSLKGFAEEYVEIYQEARESRYSPAPH